MTKKEIVKRISVEVGLSQTKTKEIVDMTMDAIVEALVMEGRIELRNFGVFVVKTRKSRLAHNPKDPGVEVYVEAKNVVTFQPGKMMEERVRQTPLRLGQHHLLEVSAGDGLDDDEDLNPELPHKPR